MSRPFPRLALALAFLVLASCAAEPARGRVLVLGLDGLDPDAVALLAGEGRLPNLARLVREGASGRLASLEPMLSPMLWTTVATGRLPEDHGIGHFVALAGPAGRPAPVTSDLRRVESLWTIASRAGLRPAVVGWWATFPPEPVDGWIVSDRVAYHFLFPEGLAGAGAGAAASGPPRTWPPELLAEIAPRLVRPQEVGAAELAGYAEVTAADLARPFRFEDELAHLRWAIATAAGYRAVGLDLWRSRRPDLELVYVEATDSVSHLFGHLFRAEGLAGELAAQQRRYGGAVERIYALADEIVGDYLAELGDDGTLVVLSDHGFALGALHDDPSRVHEMTRVSERFHRPHGVLYLAGRGVRPGTKIAGAELVDVAPTVLALLGLPAGADMPGRALAEALAVEPPPRIASWETEDEAPREPEGAADEAGDEALLAQLRSLGYLGGGPAPDPPPAASAQPTPPRSPIGERILAARLFEAGRHAEAEAAYRRLLAQSPDDAALAVSLAGTLGAQGRFDEAAAILERAVAADPRQPEVHHNLGALAERRGRPEEAVVHYREAVRRDPGYPPSREALARLTGAPGTPPAGDAATERAEARAEEAAEAARRGDFPRALAILDAALAEAPGVARLHHYRANVLYLAGDPAGAAAALERALALDPDNVLYRENLRRLRSSDRP